MCSGGSYSTGSQVGVLRGIIHHWDSGRCAQGIIQHCGTQVGVLRRIIQYCGAQVGVLRGSYTTVGLR